VNADASEDVSILDLSKPGSSTSEEQLDDKSYLAAKIESLEKRLEVAMQKTEAAEQQNELIQNFLIVKIYTWILRKINKFLTSVKFAWDMSVCLTLSCWKYTTSALKINKFILILLMICGSVLFLIVRFYEVKL